MFDGSLALICDAERHLRGDFNQPSPTALIRLRRLGLESRH